MDETLRREVRFLTTRLGAIVLEQCGPKTFEAIESLRRLSKEIRQDSRPELIEAKQQLVERLPLGRAEEVAHAFSLFFHLVNLCEERQRIRRLEEYSRHDTGAPMSLRRTFTELARQKVPPERLARLLGSMHISPVLTAHPTEAKRRSVFNHVLRIGRTMETLAGDFGVHGAGAIDAWIEALWLTDETRERPVTAAVEIESGLVFLERTIYDLAGAFWEKFTQELARFAPRLEARPFFSFGSWIGADRDGNPNVTAATSLEAAERLRGSILNFYLASCRRLLGLLSFPAGPPRLSRALERAIERDMRRFPATRAFRSLDQPHELYRLKLRIMIWRLERTRERAPGGYANASEFAEDAALLERLLAEHPSPRVAKVGPGRLRVSAEVFGFHGARLDFRQHTGVVRTAADELLAAARLSVAPDGARIESIRKLLTRPPLRFKFTSETRRTIDEFNTLGEAQRRGGEAAASPFILSMTSRASDVWDALLLARQAGLVIATAGNLRSTFDVVPLFETVQDLEAGPEILDQLFSDTLYRRLLRSRGNFQEVMLGYSDSVKDSGYLAANVALFRAQKRLGGVAARHGVRLGLFHGKGGTIDRGGGQSYQSLQAQPNAAPGGRIRITEQGEVISLKYSNLAIAERNLEQLVVSVLDAHLLHHQRVAVERVGEWEQYAIELAASSRDFYRQLVYETPEFLTYFRQATPIDLIEQLRLGSRPSRRAARGGDFDIHNLRAIPWVFAWTQSRHFLPSWYGLGWALEKFAADHGPAGPDLLREMYRSWPFFAVLINNAEISLAKTDLYIAGRYAALVRPQAVGQSIFGRIKEEYRRSVRWVLDICGSPHLLARQPVLEESIRLRNPYVDPLNFLQLRFLETWRRSRRANPQLWRLLQISVAGVAFGMKSTG